MNRLHQHQRHQSLPQLQTTSVQLPHHSHADPWALDYICCDGPHSASASGTGKACEGAEGCCIEPSCGTVECCTDPSCAVDGCDQAHQSIDYAKSGGDGLPMGDGDELMRWASSKEGCEAIQQYVSKPLPEQGRDQMFG